MLTNVGKKIIYNRLIDKNINIDITELDHYLIDPNKFWDLNSMYNYIVDNWGFLIIL